MAKEILDATDIEWSQVVFRIAVKIGSMKHGDVLEITGTHPSLEDVIMTWCERVKKKVIAINPGDRGGIKCQIQF
jgi:TusA-related sulfurtransferase